MTRPDGQGDAENKWQTSVPAYEDKLTAKAHYQDEIDGLDFKSDERKSSSGITCIHNNIALPEFEAERNKDVCIGVEGKLEKYLALYHSSLVPEEAETPVNHTNAHFTVGNFGQEGGFLELRSFDVSLYIPQGALPAGKTTEIFLYVSWNNRDLPEPIAPQCPVGPVIWCGQHGTQFSQHVILSFPQLVKFAGNEWQYRVMRSDTGIQASTQWTDVTSNPDNCAIPMGHKCLLLVDHFTGHTVTAVAERGAIRTVNVGVYGGPILLTDEAYNFKVGFWSGNAEITSPVSAMTGIKCTCIKLCPL